MLWALSFTGDLTAAQTVPEERVLSSHAEALNPLLALWSAFCLLLSLFPFLLGLVLQIHELLHKRGRFLLHLRGSSFH